MAGLAATGHPAAGLAVQRGDAGGLTWETARRPARPALSGLIGDLCGYAEYSAVPVRRRQAPVAWIPVILSLGPAMTVGGGRFTSFAVGLHDVSAQTEFSGAQRGVELRFSPQAAYRLLGLPPGEFTNRAVQLPALDRIAARAADAPDWATSLDVVEEHLLRLAADGPEPDRAVAWAWEVMRRRRGVVPVGALAAEIGWSRRHFAARFRAEVGLAPKAAARVLRFERAATLLAAGVPAAAVAARSGYADQSHLVREFRALAGCTPTAFLAERDAEQIAYDERPDPDEVTFVQDGAPAPV